MKNNKKNTVLDIIYKRLKKQTNKFKNKWTLEYDQEDNTFIIDDADHLFYSTTDDCIYDEKNSSIILGVFGTMTECVEYYNNIVKIKNEKDHDKHGHVNFEEIKEYPLRMSDCSSSFIDIMLEKESKKK